jgi:hypothetical protein
MIDDIFNFTFDFPDTFVRPKTPTRKVTGMDKVAG